MRKQVYSQRRAGVRSLVLFLLAAALLLFLLLRTDRAVRPNLEAVCASETKRYATQVLADSVGEVLSRHPYQYSDFATLLYDDSGNVTAVETMTEQVNRLQSAMLQKCAGTPHPVPGCGADRLSGNCHRRVALCRKGTGDLGAPDAHRNSIGKAGERAGVRRHQPDLPYHSGRGDSGDAGSHSVFPDNGGGDLYLSAVGNGDRGDSAGILSGI